MKTQKEVVRYREVSKDEKNLVRVFFVCFFLIINLMCTNSPSDFRLVRTKMR